MPGRFACLLVPRFVVAALLRAEPELRGVPLVVCDAGSRATVLDVSVEAERAGAQRGLTVAQALIRHADLVVRPLDVATLDAARAALLEVGRSVSPLVEDVGGDAEGDASAEQTVRTDGEIVIDVAGLERLFGSPAGIAAALAQRAERIGLPAGVGIADGRATARIAAGVAVRRREAILVAPGGDAAWLASLPLATLSCCARDVDAGRTRSSRQGFAPVVERLARLGVTRCGELAAMPVDEVASRLGKVATRLWYVAAGRDRTPLRPCTVPHEHVEGTRLEYGIASLEALLFVVRGLLERVTARLATASFGCGGLALTLALDDGSRIERAIGVLAPTRDVKTLLLLVRGALEASPPHAAVEAVQVTALPDRPRADQLDLFRPAGPPPARLATTLARLSALCGSERVGRAAPPPGHRPDAFRLLPFETPCGTPTPAPERAELPLVGSCAALALRALRPPRAAQVFVEAGRIAYVRAVGLGGRAVVTSGPWRIDAEWWSESPCRRDYYDVQLSDGGVYRLYRDLDATRPDSTWYVDGCYD